MRRLLINSLITAINVFFISKSNAQYSYNWAKQLAGEHSDWAYDVTVDNDGNVITSGSFMIAADFDPSVEGVAEMTSIDNNSHAYICKLDADGNYVWARSLSGKSFGRAVIADQDGNIYMGGGFIGPCTFNGGSGEITLNSIGVHDAFLAKYSTDGDLLWVKSFGGEDNDSVTRIAITDDGDIVVCGYFVYSMDADPGPSETVITTLASANQDNVFVSKFSSTGDFLWNHYMGGSSVSYPNDIVINSEDEILVVGQFASEFNCDPLGSNYTFETNGSTDWEVFVVNLSSSGDFQWAKRVGGPSQDVANGIALDADNNMLITGYFGVTTDFDPNDGVVELTVNGASYDVFVLKLDVNGNFVWVQQMGSTTTDIGMSVAVDANGNVYSTGQAGGVFDFDLGVNTVETDWHGAMDVYLSVLNANGEYQWGETFGAHENDWGNRISVDDEHIYVAGIFQENFAEFGDFVLMGEGNEDAFVLKLTYPPFTGVDEENVLAISLFPNPTNDKLFLSINDFALNSDYVMTIMDNSGKVVWSSNQIFKNINMDVSDFAEGVYLISLHNSVQTINQPFVVIH
jgi:hypothetical protein